MYERRVEESKSLFDKFKIFVEYIKVKNYERMICNQTDKQILISEADKNYMAKFADMSKTAIIGLATDTNYYAPVECEKENNICFVGSMQYIPNSEAAKYFALEVFPLIKKEIPGAKFKIIGANPRKDLIKDLKNAADVEITGRVGDVREYMKDCKVSVCPVKIAGGIQNKILEAMSMGIPVVTTFEGAEGINAPESILQVAKTNEEYAAKVAGLLKNNELNNDISRQSRAFVCSNFSWIKVGEDWDKMIKEVCGE